MKTEKKINKKSDIYNFSIRKRLYEWEITNINGFKSLTILLANLFLNCTSNVP